jgi:hypothetical protein
VAVSLNGWVAIANSSDPRLKWQPIPGTSRKVLVRRVAGPLFGAFCADWNRLMPERLKLDKGPVDGWEYRDARTTARLSNHASGSAVDLRYDVLLADGKSHMTAIEKQVLADILAIYVLADGRCVFRSGAYWNTVDEMHMEIAPGMTVRDVKSVIKRLRIDADGVRPGA